MYHSLIRIQVLTKSLHLPVPFCLGLALQFSRMLVASLVDVGLVLKSKHLLRISKDCSVWKCLGCKNGYRVPHDVDMLTIMIYDLWKLRPLTQLSSRWASTLSVHWPEMIQFKIPI